MTKNPSTLLQHVRTLTEQIEQLGPLKLPVAGADGDPGLGSTGAEAFRIRHQVECRFGDIESNNRDQALLATVQHLR